MTENSPDPTDDDRMRAAIELAGQQPTSTATSPQRPPVRTTGWWVIALIGVAIAAILGLAESVNDGATTVPTWRTGLGWAVLVAGCIAAVGLFVRSRRDGTNRRTRSAVLEGLSAAQRKSVRRQMVGKDAVVPAQLPVVRSMAILIAGIEPKPGTVAAIVAIFVGNAIRSGTGGKWYFVGFLILVWAGGTLLTSTQVRRARAFLATHPAPTTEATP